MSVSRRGLLRGTAASAALACGPGPTPASVSARPSKHPNILFVFPDQLRTMSIGGPNIDTPNIDALLAASAYFPETITPDPLCTPARATLVTGRHAHQLGISSNFAALPNPVRSLATIVRDAGYATGFIGKWHLAYTDISGYVPPTDRADFEDWFAFNFGHNYFSSIYYTDGPEPLQPEPPDLFEPIYQTELALDYMTAARDRPFFLMLGYGPPHPAGQAPIDWTEGYPASFFEGLDPEELVIRPNVPDWILEPRTNDPWGGRLHLQGYLAATRAMDACLGRLFDGMKDAGLWEDTLIVFTSDHGEMGGSHGRYQKSVWFEEALRVPLAFHWPAWLPAGCYPVQSSLVDIAPTLLGLAGLPAESLPGTDLSPWAFDGLGPTRGHSYFKGRQGHEDHFRGVRTGDWKYVSFDTLTRRRLYDLTNDPYELNNLAFEDGYTGIQADLDALVHEEQVRLDDPGSI